jgi:hypothetical protein
MREPKDKRVPSKDEDRPKLCIAPTFTHYSPVLEIPQRSWLSLFQFLTVLVLVILEYS